MDWFCQHYPTTTSHHRYSRCGWVDPVPTATAVLPPMGQGLCEDSPWPRGEPCRWARRVTPALSGPGGAAAQSDEGAGALGRLRGPCCAAWPGKERRKVRWWGGQGHRDTQGHWGGLAQQKEPVPLPRPCLAFPAPAGFHEAAGGRAVYVGFLVRVHEETWSF